MRIIEYNQTLLTLMRQLGNCTMDELKNEYLTPNQPGIIQGNAIQFHSDLKQLEHLGCVFIDDEQVSYIKMP